MGQPGVDRVYAMQAGRDVRVMVLPEQVDDIAAQILARDIAKQIEEELTYPGQIKVTVIRESRAVDIARNTNGGAQAQHQEPPVRPQPVTPPADR